MAILIDVIDSPRVKTWRSTDNTVDLNCIISILKRKDYQLFREKCIRHSFEFTTKARTYDTRSQLHSISDVKKFLAYYPAAYNSAHATFLEQVNQQYKIHWNEGFVAVIMQRSHSTEEFTTTLHKTFSHSQSIPSREAIRPGTNHLVPWFL